MEIDLVPYIVIPSIGLIFNVFALIYLIKYSVKTLFGYALANHCVIHVLSTTSHIIQIANNPYKPFSTDNTFTANFYCIIIRTDLVGVGLSISSAYSLLLIVFERYLYFVRPMLHHRLERNVKNNRAALLKVFTTFHLAYWPTILGNMAFFL